MRTELKNILSGNGIGFVKDAIGCVSLVLILFAGFIYHHSIKLGS